MELHFETAGAEASSAAALSRDQVHDLYQEHSRELWSRFYAKCRDAELASDLVQESFRRLWANRTTIAKPLSWLRRVGVNLMIDRARRLASRPTMSFRTDLIPCENDEPWQLMATREAREEIVTAMNRLRASDQEILRLRYALDLGSREIGELLEIATDAVDMRLCRARRRLLQAVAGQGLK